jgi:hypothetical protein
MKAIRFVRAVVAELVSLVVDDAVTFVGGVAGLALMYLLAHEVRSWRSAGGFVAFALVWGALALSFARAIRRARD